MTYEASMKIIISIMLFFFFSFPVLAKDTLWDKAVLITEKNKNYRSGNIVLYIDDLNKDGTVASSQEIHQKIRLGKEIKYDTTKVIKDGKDITQEALKKNQSKNRKSFLDESDIFDKKVQNKISIKKLNQSTVNGINCDTYSYRFEKNDKEKYDGKAWINNQNGNPVKVEYTLNPLPMGLKNILITYNYENKKDKNYIKNIKAEGEASLIIFKKIFRMKADLKNYRDIQ